MAFERRFKDENIDTLKRDPLFNGCLKDDVLDPYSARLAAGADTSRDKVGKGDVFPAVRKDRIDFYHRGGKLFSYWGNRDKGECFTTHHKYASVIEHNDKDDDYVNDKNLRAIDNFVDGYPRIKQNCAHYAGDEAFGVSRIYEKFSCAKSVRRHDVVVLDIEVALKRDKKTGEDEKGERSGSDRIDLLLFDTKSKLLRFFEAKLFSNSCLRSRSKGIPTVAGQMASYRKQMDTLKKREELLKGYIEHVNVINKLFELSPRLPMPKEIDPEPRLLIFDFDRVQLKHRLEKEVDVLRDKYKHRYKHELRVYPIGGIGRVNPETLFNDAK